MREQQKKLEGDKPTLQDRLAQIDILMTEALAITEHICGSEPYTEPDVKPGGDTLSIIEHGLGIIVGRTRQVVSQLQRIERRL